jgi:AcrR family transcriptional regulator
MRGITALNSRSGTTGLASERPPFRGRTRETAAVRRAKILDAAMCLIGERGYYGFTIQELGRRCGLSNPGLLHYFPSKQDVLLGVLHELEVREAEFMEPLAQMAFHASADRPSQMTLHILLTMVDRATANPKLARVLVGLHAEALDPSHPAHSWWREREAKTLTFLSSLLRPVVTDPDMTARLVLACMDGLFLQWLSARQEEYATLDWQLALERLLPELHA